MLDKSVPYAGIYMRREQGAFLPHCPLADGFRFTFYSDGAERDWARIETSVLEFDSEFAALLYYNDKFMPHKDKLTSRCIFIETESGEKIATATAWWDEVDGKLLPWLHWVAVMPEYQGFGLGKALICEATRLMTELEGDAVFYLHTQTWSHKAIEIYRLMGYNLTDDKKLYRATKDNYKRAVRILKRIQRKG